MGQRLKRLLVNVTCVQDASRDKMKIKNTLKTVSNDLYLYIGKIDAKPLFSIYIGFL